MILENDLDLHSIDFTPIPTFSGTFQGNGHTISGLTLTGSGNGRVRGRISGFVDAEIHGVVKGDISAIMSSGSYDLPEGSGQPPEAGPSPEDTPNTPPADSVTGKEGDAQ